MSTVFATPIPVQIRGAQLHYLEMGSGEPVVLVHGSLGDYRSWTHQVAPFAERYRVITYSRRYHFPNAWSGDGLDYSAQLHADDLAGLFDSLEIERAHVVSASYGSYCALVFARLYPERVKSVVATEPPVLGWLRDLPGGEELVRPFIENALIPSREAFVRDEYEEGVRRFIDGVVGRTGAFNSFQPAIRAGLMDNAREMKAETLSNRLFPAFACEDAKEVRAPVLLLAGEKSPAFFRRIVQELERCLPHRESQVLAGVSHNLNSARPRLYNQAVLEFLDRVSGIHEEHEGNEEPARVAVPGTIQEPGTSATNSSP